ncbi:MAG: SufD family Fe-S cluster assembly protein [Eggerthellaceae bacterium]|nr:SufD family Fe-S cluster assembly protein [Eggerthellaceae bacterium]
MTKRVTYESEKAMSVDLSPIDQSLLEEIASIHGMPKGAYNIRKDGQLLERNSSANIEISTKTDNPGIDIHIKPGTKGETVYIPVILTASGLKDVVYNSFYVGENCDVNIIAGCGIHNSCDQDSEHDGIHSFYCGENSRVRYIEKHYGEGEGAGMRILNPVTNVYLEKNSYCEMELTQIRGVSSTVRDTNAEVGEGAKLVLNEKLLTHDEQTAVSNMKVELKGDDSSVQVISRSVAQGNSSQTFNPLVIGQAACRGHVQCDAIIMDKARVTAIPGIEAASEEAVLVHEAAIGKIAGDQIVKLMTLGLSEEEAEAEILEDFLS